MGVVNLIVRGVTGAGTALANVLLLVVMMIVVASVVARFAFGVAISGSYELTQLFISVTIAFSIVYTALHKGHVVVHVVLTKLPGQARRIGGIVTSLLSLVFWGLVAWAAAGYAIDKGLRETSETLDVPHLPFRVLLALGIVLLALSYLPAVVKGFRKTAGD